MTPMKLKMMGDVLFEGLLVVGEPPTVTDTLGVGIILTGSVSVEIADPVTLSTTLTVVEFTVFIAAVFVYKINFLHITCHIEGRTILHMPFF